MKIKSCCKFDNIRKLLIALDFRIALEIDGSHYAVKSFDYKTVSGAKDMYEWEMILEKLAGDLK